MPRCQGATVLRSNIALWHLALWHSGTVSCWNVGSEKSRRQHPRGDRRYAHGADQPHHPRRDRRRRARQGRDLQPGQLDQGPHGGQDDRGRRDAAAGSSPAAPSSKAPPATPGMGLAIAAVVKGYKCIFTTTDKQSKEKVDALQAFGAEVIVCPTNVEPEDPRSYYSVSSRLEREDAERLEGQPVRQPVELRRRITSRPARRSGSRPTAGSTHLVSASAPAARSAASGEYLKEKKPASQGVGHRHLRLGLQEVQGDRASSTRTRSTRTSRKASARTSCRRTWTSRSSTTSRK